MSSVIYKVLVPTFLIPHADLSKCLPLYPASLYFFTFTAKITEHMLSTVAEKAYTSGVTSTSHLYLDTVEQRASQSANDWWRPSSFPASHLCFPRHILQHPRDGLKSTECCEFLRELNQNSQGGRGRLLPGRLQGAELIYLNPKKAPGIPGPGAQQQQDPRHLGPGVAETPALGWQHVATPCSDPLTSVELQCTAGRTYLRSSWRRAWS